MGPTACGKTRVAVELARKYPVEIISVDSALVYRGLDIGSGKPDKATLAQTPHRLVDIRDPAEAYSAAEFRVDAIKAIDEILQAGKLPLLVGGTMLYFKVLRDGLAAMPAAAPEVRAHILEMAARDGWPALHRRLQEIDPVAAKRIHPNDPQRLQRALEVYEVSGQSLTALHRQDSAGQVNDLPCNLLFVAMLPDRGALHDNIARRFDAMLDAGLIEEVRQLRSRGDLHAGMPAIRSVGYRQVWNYLDNEYSYSDMVCKAQAATRQLAKRQYTWLRGWPDVHRLQTQLSSEDGNIVENHLKSLPAVSNYW